MNLLDPKNTDVADLLAAIRDIGDQLGGIEGQLDRIDDRLDGAEYSIDRTSNEIAALITTEPGHERAVLLAVHAVINDMETRRSLIPVADDDSEYEQGCVSCLLKKNGYPRLAGLLADHSTVRSPGQSAGQP